jgi:hypothetical protein
MEWRKLTAKEHEAIAALLAVPPPRDLAACLAALSFNDLEALKQIIPDLYRRGRERGIRACCEAVAACN